MRTKWFIVFCMILIAVTGVSAQQKVIGVSSQHLTNDFNRGVTAGIAAQAKTLGYQVIMTNAKGDTNQQVADIENFLSRKVSAVIIAGGEGPAFGPVMKKLKEAKIPVVTVDIPSEYSVCNVTSDNFNGGEQLGLYVANRLRGKGNVLVLDTPGWHSLDIRIRMLKSVIMDYAGIKIVQTIETGVNDAVNSYYQQVKAYLLANQDVQAVYCSWGLAAVGASNAIRELGRQKEIFVVCTDADQVVLQEMLRADSPLTAVVGQYPDRLGSISLNMAVAAINGKTVPVEAYAPIILTEKDNPEAWFSSPAVMKPADVWKALFPNTKMK
jgi:ribose transport system substrate-binding protein